MGIGVRRLMIQGWTVYPKHSSPAPLLFRLDYVGRNFWDGELIWWIICWHLLSFPPSSLLLVFGPCRSYL
jgi:hypothetical protein